MNSVAAEPESAQCATCGKIIALEDDEAWVRTGQCHNCAAEGEASAAGR